MLQVYSSAVIKVNVKNFCAKNFMQLIQSIKHSMMFNPGGNDTLHSQISNGRIQNKIIGFCATRGEDNFRSCHIKCLRHCFSGLFYKGFRAATKCMGRGRISIDLPHHLGHAVYHFLANLRGCGVIKVDFSHGPQK